MWACLPHLHLLPLLEEVREAERERETEKKERESGDWAHLSEVNAREWH